MKNKIDNFRWKVVVVYGSAYEEHKQEFLDELTNVSSSSSIPMLIGGDFNMVRETADRSAGNINTNWTNKFNDWVNSSALMELKIANRQFTWCNNQTNRIMAELDRVFMITCWEAHHPLADLSALPRVTSDHTPLVVHCDLQAAPLAKIFRFEKLWLSVEGFNSLIIRNWNLSCPCTRPIEVWRFKIRRVRKILRGWNRNVEADQKKRKQ